MPWVRMHACAQGSGRVSNGAVIVIKSLSINGVCVYAVCGFVGCVCAQVRKVSSGEVIVNEGDDGHADDAPSPGGAYDVEGGTDERKCAARPSNRADLAACSALCCLPSALAL